MRSKPFRRPAWRPSVRLLALFFCLWLGALEGWRTWRARDVEIAEDKIETSNLAKSLAQHAHDVVQVADAFVTDLRQRIETDSWTAEKLQQLDQLMAMRVAAVPAINALYITDANGETVASSLPIIPRHVNDNDGDYALYHRAHQGRTIFVGNPIRSRIDNAWLITISKRIDKAGGGFGGIVIATVAVDFLQAYFHTFDTGYDGSIFLGSTKGIIIAREPANYALIGTDVSQAPLFRDLLPRSPTGSYKFTSPIDNVTRLGSYQVTEDYPLVTVVSHGLNERLTDWRRDSQRHLAIDVTAFAILIFLAGRYDRQIAVGRALAARYRLLADNSSDAIICVGPDGQVQYVSPSFTTMTGWGSDEVMSRGWVELVHPDDRLIVAGIANRLRSEATQVEASFRYICRDRPTIWVEARSQRVAGGEGDEAQFVASIRDISLRKVAEDQVAALHRELSVQAITDGLTGLANRRRFDEAIGQEWRRAARQQTPLSLLMIDVDHFKLYNDLYGHPQGDVCLRAVAAAIGVLGRRPGDLAARYGGEEIVLLLPGAHAAGAAEIAHRACDIIRALKIPHDSNGPFGVVTISVGAITTVPHAEELPDPVDLIKAADAALYEAKRTGRNRAVIGSMPVQPVELAHQPIAGGA